MPNDKKPDRGNRRIQDLANSIKANMDSIYQQTYFSSPQASNDADAITQSIHNNIDSIVNRNMNTIGAPSISVLYSRIFEKNASDGSGSEDLKKLFEEPTMMDDLYSSFLSNRFLRELDDEIDTVCKYMPELQEALDVKKDAVLSADHFSKDFLSVRFPANISDSEFTNRIDELKKKYDLQQLAEEIYDDTSRYGEKFIYIVPYKTAIARLLSTKANTVVQKPFAKMESGELLKSLAEATVAGSSESTKKFNVTFNENGFRISDSNNCKITESKYMITESVVEGGKHTQKKTSFFKAGEGCSFNVELNNSGIIDSAIIEAAKVQETEAKKPRSLSESFFMEQATAKSSGSLLTEESSKNKPEASGNHNFNNVFKNVVNDGFVTSKPDSPEDFKVKAPGAVVKYLKRENVIPVYIEQSCIGYYYIEFRNREEAQDLTGFRSLLTDPITSIGGDTRNNFSNVEVAKQDETIRYVAGQLSQFIDKNFVNSNQDIAKEIYEILKYNDIFNTPSMDNIKVTFVPPEDIHHSWFVLDEDLHRGISDLAKGLIPAKLFSSLYITNTIGIMTRGQDKRVYYVKNMVDTNIAQQLLNVINQIKLGNFGIRQFNSINSILNITGRFNDYVIPQSPSGDSPITMDVIQGQQFDTHQELMDTLKEMAIDSTGVPVEIIATRKSVDYASQLSMSSSKFLRTVYKRQERFQKILSRIVSAIYAYEYGDRVDLKVILPPPVFLDMANTNQLVTNTVDFVNSLIELELADSDDDKLKARAKLLLFKHYIGTHVDLSEHEDIFKQAEMQLKKEAEEAEVQTEAPEDNQNDYY